MNPTDYPSLGNTVAGFVFHQQELPPKSKAEQQAVEIACVDLISQLENQVAKANDMARDDFIDESADIGRKILARLSEFSSDFLEGKSALQAKNEIQLAQTFCYTYEQVLKTRTFTNAILRTFWMVEESDAIKAAHAQLGDALARSCATVLYHAVVLIGNDSESGKQIDQSTLVFVQEMKQAWN